MSYRRVASIVALLAAGACGRPPGAPAASPAVPASVDEFRAEASRILGEAGVPGAGLALVRAGGVEWAGGIGFADRDRRTPVAADTHFRVGSISKTFVAVALVQQYEDGNLDLEAPVADFAPDVAIDNRYTASPVTVLQLLQHTAGFDDMHFNETYNVEDPPDLSLFDVLRRNPASRRVRWRPGTRMSYSNPGYAVAAHVLERVTGHPYEEVIRERIFAPLDMRTSSFVLAQGDLPLLAKGYDSADGPPVPDSQIYLRPAGNLHTSPAELARFVQLLLNWGETTDNLVIDPEYLSNMERPRSSLAAKAGLIYGYGAGIVSRSVDGFPVLGHDGGIDGFLSTYGYSAARDVGWVVLVNSTHAPEVVDRLSSLALGYLKRNVERPAKPELIVAPTTLAAHQGYYHPEGGRSAVFEPVEWLTGGTTIRVEGNALSATPALGPTLRLVPVSDTLFRRSDDVTPSRVFTTDEDGRTVLLGDGYYGVRTPRWRIEVVRGPVLLSLGLIVSVPLALVLWVARFRVARPQGFWALKMALALLPLALAAIVGTVLWVPARDWGGLNTWTRLVFLGTWAMPIASLVALALWTRAWRDGAGPWLRIYTLLVTSAGLAISGFLAIWGLVGLRPWAY
ncbi:MAG: beta-lactamase family protein [Acidobacteriota bacterium]|nr:beta-lactamase family protein [Acidobacteriota bacterium]